MTIFNRKFIYKYQLYFDYNKNQLMVIYQDDFPIFTVYNIRTHYSRIFRLDISDIYFDLEWNFVHNKFYLVTEHIAIFSKPLWYDTYLLNEWLYIIYKFLLLKGYNCLNIKG